MTSYFSRLAPDMSRPRPHGLALLNIPKFSTSSNSGSTSAQPSPSPSRSMFGRAPTTAPEESYENRDFDEHQIKCSDCGTWMDVMQLGEHVCSLDESSFAKEESADRVSDSDERSELPYQNPRHHGQHLRVDIEAAAGLSAPLKVAGSASSSRSFTDPLTASRSPRSPATPASSNWAAASTSTSSHSKDQGIQRSQSSNSIASAASSNKLPFFEKYQRLVRHDGTLADRQPLSSPTTTFSRSPTSDTLALQANSRRTPSPETSKIRPSPSSTLPVSNPTGLTKTTSSSSIGSSSNDSLGAARSSKERGVSPAPSQRSYESKDSRASSNGRSRQYTSIETQASTIGSNSPPRSKYEGPDESDPTIHIDHEDFYAAYDDHRRATLKASHSTPAALDIYAKPVATLSESKKKNRQPGLCLKTSSFSTPASSLSRSASSNSGLDACLEDLRLMTESDEDEEYDPLANDYYDRRLTTSGPFDEDFERTPRVPVPLPQSRSSPAYSSSTALASLAGSSSARYGSVKITSAPVRSQTPPTKRCMACRRDLSNTKDCQRAGDGQIFCRKCYNDRYLPKCRKCSQAIEGGAVTSSDGKVLGKYHKECFTCFTCSASFPNGDFYVFEFKPFCQQHYHEKNGSICANNRCGRPIEGPCVSLIGPENGGGGRYHAEHFVCSRASCGIPLLEHHFVVFGLPFCERHADGNVAPSTRSTLGNGRANDSSNPGPSTLRAKKRQTIITRR